MRRKDREITDRAEIDTVLNEATVCRIGLADNGEPYVVPMCFGYDGTFLYLHSVPEASNPSGSSRVSFLTESDGKKITMIRKNPRCCIEVDICDRVIRGDKPCSWGMRYRSVIGYGRAEIITDPTAKQHGLNRIMEHYGGGTHDFSEKDLACVTVIRIPLESVTGKKHE
jgi:uncharacterized protein